MFVLTEAVITWMGGFIWWIARGLKKRKWNNRDRDGDGKGDGWVCLVAAASMAGWLAGLKKWISTLMWCCRWTFMFCVVYVQDECWSRVGEEIWCWNARDTPGWTLTWWNAFHHQTTRPMLRYLRSYHGEGREQIVYARQKKSNWLGFWVVWSDNLWALGLSIPPFLLFQSPVKVLILRKTTITWRFLCWGLR